MDYNWHKIKEEIYYVDGSWRDIYVNNITENQWEKWVNYVNENYTIDWNNRNKIDFEKIKNYWEKGSCQNVAKIFIGHIQINCHFFSNFENDIDPNDIKNINDHNCIINYMKNVSKILDTTIYLSGENWHENYLFKIYKGEIYGI